MTEVGVEVTPKVEGVTLMVAGVTLEGVEMTPGVVGVIIEVGGVAGTTLEVEELILEVAGVIFVEMHDQAGMTLEVPSIISQNRFQNLRIRKLRRS